ncbi:MAG: adenylate/guanylate cyclase domain-containing protein [Sneathiella sp.]
MILLPSLALIDLAFTLLYAGLSGNWNVLGQATLLNLIILGGLNVIVGRILINPVRLAEENQIISKKKLTRRLRNLPRLACLWVFCLTLFFVGLNFSFGTFLLPKNGDLEVPNQKLLAAIGWFSFVYACQFSLFAYFIGMDTAAYARKWLLKRHSLVLRSQRRSFAVRVIFGMIIITFLPASIIVLDALYFVDVRALQGLTLDQAIILDVAATVITACLSVFFLTRSFTQPLKHLQNAMGGISNNLDTVKVAEMTDDELGQLSRQFNNMVRELREKEAIRGTLHKFVNRDVANLLISTDMNDPRLSGELRMATVLFTDLVGFTRLSESIEPVQLIGILNEYFDTVSKTVRKHEGLVLNYSGDSVYAIFNVPKEDPDHAENAVRCALELDEILKVTGFSNDIYLPTRIGINSGSVVAGLVGTDHRLEYSAYGDVVNVASRLEAMNKDLGTTILASGATCALASNLTDAGVVFTSKGAKSVRGKTNKIDVYEISDV